MKKVVNLKNKNEIAELVKVVNNDFTPTKKTTIRQLEAEASKERLHPQGFSTDIDLKLTFALYIKSLGFTPKANKKYGIVAKDGRKTVLEFYDLSEYDNRIHVYGTKELVEKLTANKKLKGFLTTNDHWSLGQRFEITVDSWCEFVEPLYHEYLVATK